MLAVLAVLVRRRLSPGIPSDKLSPFLVSHSVLVAAMGGNTGLGDNEMAYEMAASRDKDFIVVEGATHNLGPCLRVSAI